MIYVLHVSACKEMEIRDELRRLQFRAMVPRGTYIERKDGKQKQTEKVLMPGYVFIDTVMRLDTYYKARAIPGVIRFLGGKQPTELSAADARYIEWLSGNGKPLQPSQIGADGSITSGPLVGYEASIVQINMRNKRAKIRVNFAGESHEILLSVTVANEETAEAENNGD